MPVVSVSEAIIEIVASASDRVVIAAPYIKSHTLRRIVEAIPDSVGEVICVTRWLPEDIAFGVCDIEIFNDIGSLDGGVLLVHPHLHAKYYRGGKRCLVGSSNVTGRGLGWRTPANVELMVELPADFLGLSEWEQALVDSAVHATEDLRDSVLSEAASVDVSAQMMHLPEVDQGRDSVGPMMDWVPECPVPERLWGVYIGGGSGRWLVVRGRRQSATYRR